MILRIRGKLDNLSNDSIDDARQCLTTSYFEPNYVQHITETTGKCELS